MAEPTFLTPIELTDAELDAVSGGLQFSGIGQGESNKSKQSISQKATVVGGNLKIDGASTAVNGTIDFDPELYVDDQYATNTNSTTQSNANTGAGSGANA